MKVCMYVCLYACTQPITPKFDMGSSFPLGSAPSQGAAQNVGPLLLLSPLDQICTGLFHNCIVK